MSDNAKATIRRIVEAVWRGASAAFGPDLVSWDGLDLEAREQLIMQATGHLHDVGLAALVELPRDPRLEPKLYDELRMPEGMRGVQ